MKIVVKNSGIEFKDGLYSPVTLEDVLNTPYSYYVDQTGAVLERGGSGGGNILYVNIYAVEAGTTYYIVSDSDWNTNNNVPLTQPVSISFATNRLTDEGNLTNASQIKLVNAKNTPKFEVSFTPVSNGYIYITEVDYGSTGKATSQLYT